ncbi:MAG: hypothetical protein AAGE52_37175 [Myxococcota bacterium]
MRLLIFCLCLGVVGCGDDDGAGVDSSVGTDSGATDSGAADSGATDSGATDSGATDSGAADSGATDSGADSATDSGATDAATDSGVDASRLDAGRCADEPIGRLCRSERDCGGAYTCNEDSRCVPDRGRPTCGGIGGIACTTRAFPNCLMGPDVIADGLGVCVSTEEFECACRTDYFICRGI